CPRRRRGTSSTSSPPPSSDRTRASSGSTSTTPSNPTSRRPPLPRGSPRPRSRPVPERRMLWKRTARPLTIRFGAKTDVGRVRSENQDDYGRFPEMRAERDGDQLFVVADGMGGHEDGGRAS